MWGVAVISIFLPVVIRSVKRGIKAL
jgi:hypothetical protein